MCGIVGVLAFEDSHFRVQPRHMERMRDTMVHRGPDGAGLWISPDQRVGLGHRRLSIIDLSTVANQPMGNEDGTLWVTFNGEIYNHAQVRAELERLGGHQWKTDHSDTEVILHAFEQWGIDCLQKLRGMFAIALWDARREHLWLIRDRIGEKPLYYSIHHGLLQFASEIKALLADPDQKREVNEEGLFHYLSFLTAPAPQTLFDGIRKLPPATWMRIDKHGRIATHCYWDVWDHTEPLTGVPDREVAERVLTELRSTVRLLKVSDVPVGVFLSGGIDSSTNAALFSEGEGGPVRTFSIGYQGELSSYRNEFAYARLVARQVGAEHQERHLCLDDLLDFLPRMIELHDEPIGDPVCVPVYYVSKLARDNGVVVCQVGEGADELFCGYPTWLRYWRLQRLLGRLPAAGLACRAARSGLNLLGLGRVRLREALRRVTIGRPMFWGSADCLADSEKLPLLSARLRRRFARHTAWDIVAPIHQRFQQHAWEPSVLNWMSYLDLRTRLPESLLMRVDKMGMGVSLEGRVPFLDHKFVELAMSIPEAVKLRHGSLKHILKEAVRGVIPDEVIRRRKQGFGVPVRDWLFDRLGERVHD